MADDARARFWLRLARVAGALPLCAGLLIFAGWLVFDSPGWMLAGFVTIGVGTALVLLGGVALWRYRRLSQATTVGSAANRPATLGTAALLIVNFPVAAVLVVAAMVLESVWIVNVVNASEAPFEGARITGGGVDEQIEHLDPGESVRRVFWVDSDGVLELVAAKSPESTVIIEDYVTSLMGGRATVTVEPNGSFVVDRPDRPR